MYNYWLIILPRASADCRSSRRHSIPCQPAGGDEVDAYREGLSDSLEESERIGVMLNTLMNISEAETGLMKLDCRPVNVAKRFGGSWGCTSSWPKTNKWRLR